VGTTATSPRYGDRNGARALRCDDRTPSADSWNSGDIPVIYLTGIGATAGDGCFLRRRHRPNVGDATRRGNTKLGCDDVYARPNGLIGGSTHDTLDHAPPNPRSKQVIDKVVTTSSTGARPWRQPSQRWVNFFRWLKDTARPTIQQTRFKFYHPIVHRCLLPTLGGTRSSTCIEIVASGR
jgi:hypothetical protein